MRHGFSAQTSISWTLVDERIWEVEVIDVRRAVADDAEIVGGFIHALLSEFDPDVMAERPVDGYVATARDLLESNNALWAFIAFDGELPVGVITLSACASIYAGGAFGEIAELTVAPSHRSHGIGPLLLEAAREFGRSKGWSRLEVGAPPMPEWQRSYDFYVRNGFSEVGPRLKQLL